MWIEIDFFSAATKWPNHLCCVFLFLFISLFSIRPEMKWSQNKMSQTKFEPEGVFEESCSFESKRSSHASHASSLTCRELRTGDDSSAAPLIYKVNLLNPIRAQIRLFFFFLAHTVTYTLNIQFGTDGDKMS